MTIKAPWDGWDIIETLGRGSYGSVYKITRTQYGVTELAAMKVISIPNNPDMIENDYSCGYDKESIKNKYKSYLDVVLNEYQLMMKIKGCTNVVRCDDISVVPHEDEIGWDVYIRMEYLTPTEKKLSGKVSDATIIRLGMDLCSALNVCDKANIIHRDIKPSNILVNQEGDFKLGDFGVSRVLNDEDTYGTKGIGTYNFMAPEVYNGEKYGKAADIYSLGMVMYWLLNDKTFPFLTAGKAPTAQETAAARQRRFNGEELPRPTGGTDELVSIVLKACSFNPKDRYSSAKEMWNELNDIIYRFTSRPDKTVVPDIETTVPSAEKTTILSSSEKSVPLTDETADDPITQKKYEEFEDTVVLPPEALVNEKASADAKKAKPMAVPPVKTQPQKKSEKSSGGFLIVLACVVGLIAIVGVCIVLGKSAGKTAETTGSTASVVVEASSDSTAAMVETETTTVTTVATTTSETTESEPYPTIVLGLPESLFSYDGEYLEIKAGLFDTSYSDLDDLTRNRLTNYREWSESDSDADAVCDLGEFAFKFKDDICVSFVCIYPNRGLTLDDICDLYLLHVGDYDDVSYDKNGNIKSCEWITADNVHIHIWWDKSANCCFAEYEPAD